MTTIAWAFSLLVLGADGSDDAKSLVQTIEAAQSAVEDFRCEFEGTIRHFDESKRINNLGEDGLYDTFSAFFVWRRGGDTLSDSLHRIQPEGNLQRQLLAVRMWQNQAEHYERMNDVPLGFSVIEKPNKVNSCRLGCLGEIFLIDEIKRFQADPSFMGRVEDEQYEGRSVKILTFLFAGMPREILASRFWIDLSRNGHVLKREKYTNANEVGERLSVKLEKFKLGDLGVWMPVFGEASGYITMVKNKMVRLTQPAWSETIYVVRGTMEFNKRPTNDNFTVKYKIGTPITNNLRQLQSEFGRQKIGINPTKVEAKAMLAEQLALAEAQRSELIAADPTSRGEWISWLAWGFGVTTVVALVAFWFQRRGR